MITQNTNHHHRLVNEEATILSVVSTTKHHSTHNRIYMYTTLYIWLDFLFIVYHTVGGKRSKDERIQPSLSIHFLFDIHHHMTSSTVHTTLLLLLVLSSLDVCVKWLLLYCHHQRVGVTVSLNTSSQPHPSYSNWRNEKRQPKEKSPSFDINYKTWDWAFMSPTSRFSFPSVQQRRRIVSVRKHFTFPLSFFLLGTKTRLWQSRRTVRHFKIINSGQMRLLLFVCFYPSSTSPAL
jgi:hypothetical protein